MRSEKLLIHLFDCHAFVVDHYFDFVVKCWCDPGQFEHDFYIFICLFVCLFFGFGVYLHEVTFVESHLQRFKPYTHYTAVTGVPYHIHNEVQESIV